MNLHHSIRPQITVKTSSTLSARVSQRTRVVGQLPHSACRCVCGTFGRFLSMFLEPMLAEWKMWAIQPQHTSMSKATVVVRRHSVVGITNKWANYGDLVLTNPVFIQTHRLDHLVGDVAQLLGRRSLAFGLSLINLIYG